MGSVIIFWQEVSFEEHQLFKAKVHWYFKYYYGRNGASTKGKLKELFNDLRSYHSLEISSENNVFGSERMVRQIFLGKEETNGSHLMRFRIANKFLDELISNPGKKVTSYSSKINRNKIENIGSEHIVTLGPGICDRENVNIPEEFDPVISAADDGSSNDMNVSESELSDVPNAAKAEITESNKEFCIDENDAATNSLDGSSQGIVLYVSKQLDRNGNTTEDAGIEASNSPDHVKPSEIENINSETRFGEDDGTNDYDNRNQAVTLYTRKRVVSDRNIPEVYNGATNFKRESDLKFFVVVIGVSLIFVIGFVVYYFGQNRVSENSEKITFVDSQKQPLGSPNTTDRKRGGTTLIVRCNNCPPKAKSGVSNYSDEESSESEEEASLNVSEVTNENSIPQGRRPFSSASSETSASGISDASLAATAADRIKLGIISSATTLFYRNSPAMPDLAIYKLSRSRLAIQPVAKQYHSFGEINTIYFGREVELIELKFVILQLLAEGCPIRNVIYVTSRKDRHTISVTGSNDTSLPILSVNATLSCPDIYCLRTENQRRAKY